jgi:hypothetical protein
MEIYFHSHRGDEKDGDMMGRWGDDEDDEYKEEIVKGETAKEDETAEKKERYRDTAEEK